MNNNDSENIAYLPNSKNFTSECVHDPELSVLSHQIGSLITILHSKTINPSTFFLTLMAEEPLQTIYMKLCTFETPIEIFSHVVGLYPKLCTSKIVRERSKKMVDARRKAKKINVD